MYPLLKSINRSVFFLQVSSKLVFVDIGYFSGPKLTLQSVYLDVLLNLGHAKKTKAGRDFLHNFTGLVRGLTHFVSQNLLPFSAYLLQMV